MRDSYDHFRDVLALAKERKLLMPIRLVKGAYWDAETIEERLAQFEGFTGSVKKLTQREDYRFDLFDTSMVDEDKKERIRMLLTP